MAEFDFDDLDDMIELAETNPAMKDALQKLQKALDEAQVIYELSKPPEQIEAEQKRVTANKLKMKLIVDAWSKKAYTKKRV